MPSDGGQFDFVWLSARTMHPHVGGPSVRAVPDRQTKSRKTPTRKQLPLFSVTRPTTPTARKARPSATRSATAPAHQPQTRSATATAHQPQLRRHSTRREPPSPCQRRVRRVRVGVRLGRRRRLVSGPRRWRTAAWGTTCASKGAVIVIQPNPNRARVIFLATSGSPCTYDARSPWGCIIRATRCPTSKRTRNDRHCPFNQGNLLPFFIPCFQRRLNLKGTRTSTAPWTRPCRR
jgi:hypothetical protein